MHFFVALNSLILVMIISVIVYVIFLPQVENALIWVFEFLRKDKNK